MCMYRSKSDRRGEEETEGEGLAKEHTYRVHRYRRQYGDAHREGVGRRQVQMGQGERNKDICNSVHNKNKVKSKIK